MTQTTSPDMPPEPEARPVSSQTNGDSRKWSFLGDHLAIVVSGILATLTSLRLIGVAHGDPASAVAILQHAGTSTAIVGLVATGFPVVLFALASLGLAFDQFGLRIYISIIAISLLLLPIWFALLSVAFALVNVITVAALVWRLKRARGARFRSSERRVVFERWRESLKVLLIVPLALFIVLNDQMWLPAEDISINGLSISGYVLDTNEATTVILRDRDRKVLIESGQPSSREVCYAEDIMHFGPSWMRGTALPLFMGNKQGPDYDRCSN